MGFSDEHGRAVTYKSMSMMPVHTLHVRSFVQVKPQKLD